MRTSQELTITLSEQRSERDAITERINNQIASGEEVRSDDQDALDKITSDIRLLETRFRAAMQKEDEEDRAAAAGDPDTKRRDFEELEGRCSVTAFLGEVATNRNLSGPEAEFRDEMLGDQVEPGMMPLRLLEDRSEDRTEDRAVTPVAAAAKGLGSQADIMPRVFTRSVAAELGVAMPSVPMGTRTYPVLTAGTTVSMQSPSGDQAAVAGTFAGNTLSPVRLTGAYEFRVEDLQLLRGLEEALRRDLRMALTDQMDHQVINGNGSAPNVNGFISELPAPTDAAARASWDIFLTSFVSGVDGINSYSIADIAAVIGKDTYGRMEAVYRADETDITAFAHLSNRARGIRVSSRIPAKAAKDQMGIFAKTAYPGTNAVAPIWEAVQLIRDPYTLATKGEVRITMLMLWNFKIIREAGWYLYDFQIDA